MYTTRISCWHTKGATPVCIHNRKINQVHCVGTNLVVIKNIVFLTNYVVVVVLTTILKY